MLLRSIYYNVTYYQNKNICRTCYQKKIVEHYNNNKKSIYQTIPVSQLILWCIRVHE